MNFNPVFGLRNRRQGLKRFSCYSRKRTDLSKKKLHGVCTLTRASRLPRKGGGGRVWFSLVPFKHLQLFLCSSKINQGVPRNSLLLSSPIPRNCAPCSLDPPKYSSLFSTISLIFHFHFHFRLLLKRGFPATILRKYHTEVKFADRKTALQQRN